MKRKVISVLLVIILMLSVTGCKRQYENVEIKEQTIGSSNIKANIRIDKNYTFRDYTIEEDENGITVTIRFKPYKEK